MQYGGLLRKIWKADGTEEDTTVFEEIVLTGETCCGMRSTFLRGGGGYFYFQQDIDLGTLMDVSSSPIATRTNFSMWSTQAGKHRHACGEAARLLP